MRRIASALVCCLLAAPGSAELFRQPPKVPPELGAPPLEKGPGSPILPAAPPQAAPLPQLPTTELALERAHPNREAAPSFAEIEQPTWLGSLFDGLRQAGTSRVQRYLLRQLLADDPDARPFLAGARNTRLSAAQEAAAQSLANELQVPIVIRAVPRGPVELGAVGSMEALIKLIGADWSRVPGVVATPSLRRDTVEAAVAEGLLVALPRERLGRLQALAAPWRTDTQLARLAETPRATGEPFRFAVLGDSEPGRFWFWRFLFNHPDVFQELLKRISRLEVDFSMQLGDMVSRGTPKNFEALFQLLKRLRPVHPYLTVIGNHDRSTPRAHKGNSHLYRSLFGKTDYSFDRGGFRFVVLDTSARDLKDDQLAWLDGVLDTPLRKVVFTHVPPGELKRWADYGGFQGHGGFRRGARRFMEIASRRGVQRVYLGHVHGFDVIDKDGVRYVLTGGGGSPLFPSGARSKFHHFLVVEAGADGSLRDVVHKEDGTIIPGEP